MQRTESLRGLNSQSHTGVDRFNHGTIRHLDIHVVQRSIDEHQVQPPIDEHQVQRHIDEHHGGDIQRNGIVHQDVEADIGYARSWHGFAPGHRVRELRPGFRRLMVRGNPYYYDDGIFYEQLDNYYKEVFPPIGTDLPELPDGAIEIVVDDLVYYYAGGAFYLSNDEGFIIVAPPMGVDVPELPPGAVKTFVDGELAYLFNGVYYRPTFVNGMTFYTTFSH
ncbi:MAG: hypothetical protein HQM08_28000 [Candidatus Riflebacteria bacterium]|nr:hypothetical protein [Candidatus Riflebacteria bacterium]